MVSSLLELFAEQRKKSIDRSIDRKNEMTNLPTRSRPMEMDLKINDRSVTDVVREAKSYPWKLNRFECIREGSAITVDASSTCDRSIEDASEETM